jgi:hypothetical protein
LKQCIQRYKINHERPAQAARNNIKMTKTKAKALPIDIGALLMVTFKGL